MPQNLFTFNAPYLEFLPWKERGIRHGFVDSTLNFKEDAWPSGWGNILKDLGVDDLLIDKQVHGTEMVDLRDKTVLTNIVNRDKETLFGRTGIDADSIIASSTLSSTKKLAIGVTAADCMPVLIRGNDGFAAVHAGWRGLADGVVEKAIEALVGRTKTKLEVVVGPSAGKNDYEVGQEVLEALGTTAQYKLLPSGKAHLDIVGTLEARLKQAKFDVAFYSSEISTITDLRFHSHRRSGEKAGRGLGFIVL